jgi:hypothetical protein
MTILGSLHQTLKIVRLGSVAQTCCQSRSKRNRLLQHKTLAFCLASVGLQKRSFPHELRQSEWLPASIGVKGEHRVQIQIRYRGM